MQKASTQKYIKKKEVMKVAFILLGTMTLKQD